MWRTRCKDRNKGNDILLAGSLQMDEEDGKTDEEYLHKGQWKDMD